MSKNLQTGFSQQAEQLVSDLASECSSSIAIADLSTLTIW